MERSLAARRMLAARTLRREMVRRAVLENGRWDIFLKHVLGYDLRQFHADLFAHELENRESLSLAPRGYGKSTILTMGRSLYEIVRDPNIRILIASKTALQAEVFLRGIKAHLESNRELIATFGRFQSDAKWDTREIVVAGRTENHIESTVTTVGVGGPVASRHYDLILGDDLVDEKNSRTEVQRDQVRTWFYKTLYPTVVDQTSRVSLHGTRFHPLDLWGNIAAGDQEVATMIVRAIPGDGTTPWPEKFSLERLEQLRRKLGSTIFNSQYQNDTEMMKGSIFREAWFREWSRPPTWTDDDGVQHVGWEKCDSWVGCDPAATKANIILTGRKAESDWWTIAVCSRAYDEDEGDYGREVFFRYLWRGRVTKDDYVRRVAAVYARFNPVIVAVEDVAAQEYLCQDLEKVVPVRRVSRPNDKVSRAYGLQAFFENGQILFPAASTLDAEEADTWRAAREELMLFPDGAHDDLFDAIETAAMATLGGGVEVFSV